MPVLERNVWVCSNRPCAGIHAFDVPERFDPLRRPALPIFLDFAAGSARGQRGAREGRFVECYRLLVASVGRGPDRVPGRNRKEHDLQAISTGMRQQIVDPFLAALRPDLPGTPDVASAAQAHSCAAQLSR